MGACPASTGSELPVPPVSMKAGRTIYTGSIYRRYCIALARAPLRREVSAASVLFSVAELRGEKTGSDGANTGNRQQALPESVVGKLPLKFFFNIADLLGEIFEVRM